MPELTQAIRTFAVRDWIGIDSGLALLATGLGTWIGVTTPTRLLALVAPTTGMVGVVVGAVLAGVAILVAFLDHDFLRKLAAIRKEPVRYLSAFPSHSAAGRGVDVQPSSA